MVPEIDIQSAKALLDDENAVFVDIRDPHSFQQAHIAGALAATPDVLQPLMERISADTPIVVYCYHGNSSKQATAWFHQQGFTGAKSMSGGFESWRMAAMNDPAFATEAG